MKVSARFTSVGATYSYGGYTLCLTGEGSAVIQSVVPFGGNGKLKLVRFATRPDPALMGKDRLGGAETTLVKSGFPLTPDVRVATKCPTESERAEPEIYKHLTELGVEYKKTTTQTESSEGLRVTYIINDRKRTLDVPLGVTLCAVGGTPEMEKDCDEVA